MLEATALLSPGNRSCVLQLQEVSPQLSYNFSPRSLRPPHVPLPLKSLPFTVLPPFPVFSLPTSHPYPHNCSLPRSPPSLTVLFCPLPLLLPVVTLSVRKGTVKLSVCNDGER